MFKALVIDDEHAFTEIAVRFLSGFCQVSVAATAEGALPMMESFCPDIVVVDNQLPGMPGIEFVKKVRACMDVYIVMVTIDKEDEVAGALKPQAVDCFLKKPFRRADLERALLGAIVAVKKKRGGA